MLDIRNDLCYDWGQPQQIKEKKMEAYISEEQEKTTESIENLISSIVELEDTGSISDEDTDECLHYLQRIVEITGASIDFDEYYESET